MLLRLFQVQDGQPMDVPLLELPTLLEAHSEFLGSTTKTDFEKVSRNVYFTHYRAFLRLELNNTKVSLFLTADLYHSIFFP